VNETAEGPVQGASTSPTVGAAQPAAPRMGENISICLVGPRGAGKSSLIASLTDCVVQGAHGHAPELRPALQAITRQEYERGAAAASRFEILENLLSHYDRLREDFATGGAPTSSADTIDYHFRLSFNGEAPPNVQARAPFLFEIVDVGGDMVAPDEGAATAIPLGAREKFATKMLAADVLLIVLPLLRFEECRWTPALSRLIERLTLAPDRKAKRIVVAFSQYERLFVQLGPAAFTYACDPAVAAYVLQRAVLATPWLDALRTLEAKRANVKLRFTVFSAFGFVKNFQNPNLDPQQKRDRRFQRPNQNGAPALGEFWRPFLTVDTLLDAALDRDGAFCFSHAQLEQAERALAAEGG
jgi:hypothetical protein